MKIKYILLLPFLFVVTSCNYLDIIPDDIATIEMAFNTRVNAERYLATCYNYVPSASSTNQNTGLVCGDEMWYLRTSTIYYSNETSFSVARGQQNTNDPYLNFWSGGRGGYSLFAGIRECNTFITNIDKVPDMSAREKGRWKAEVLTLKAYYIYYLMLHYGPIPLLKENVGENADLAEMRLHRASVDEVVDYAVGLIDEAINMPDALPNIVPSPQTELGRITMPAAKAIKAKILVLAASPLFNGNPMYVNFVDKENNHLFSQEESNEKWEKAAAACKEAIENAHEARIELYEFAEKMPFDISEITRLELTLRNTITSRFNSEVIWALGNNDTQAIQNICQPHLSTYAVGNRMERSCSQLTPSINIAEEFYSENGVPIDEDKDYDYNHRYEVINTPEDNPYQFIPNYQTAKLNLHREPRFYAYLGFDGGKWFTLENEDDEKAADVKAKNGNIAGMSDDLYSPTGYFTKKLVSYQNINTQAANVNYSYSFPIIRLADMYLLYAEALNESLQTPSDEVYEYVQRVRHKAGLDKGTTLQETWRQHSIDPNKPSTKEGMREIIRKERLVELAFEGHRYHDLRRWKLAYEYFNRPVKGWSVTEREVEYYYKVRNVFFKTYKQCEYLWPIKANDLNVNRNLVQNPQWN